LLGFGNVARSLCALLAEADASGRPWPLEVAAVLSRRRGVWIDEQGAGLDAAALAADSGAAGGPPVGRWREWPPGWDGAAFAARAPADVLVELTTLDVTIGQPAIAHIEAALRAGRHVVTANKGPIAWDYARLRDLAAAAGRRLLFEATVMDGAPVFNLHRHCLRGARVTGVRGILNSTTNVILQAMEAGMGFHAAVSEAQRLGVAEADPTLDIEGHDAAAKLCALANVLMDARLAPPQVVRQGIAGLGPADLAAARAAGETIKLIAEAGVGEDGRAWGRVAPRRIAARDPYALVSGTSSILTVHTDMLGELTIAEQAPLLRQTAYGVLADLLEIAATSERRPG
jgi:homoserine dehydrogenase